jgi:phospholipase C
VTRGMWSWSSARRVFRLPAWAAAVAVAFLVGAAVGPIAVSAQAGSPSRSGQAVGASGGRFHLDHVFVIMMENTSYDDLLSPSNTNTTYIQHLTAANGLADNYFGVTHDSLPNYIAATSGQTWGSNSDDTAQAPLFNHQNLVDQLETAHVSWKAYMEDLPFAGDVVDSTPDGLYVRKHDPFLMYPDVYNNPARADNVVPLTQLTTDLSSGKVPQFVWISPNICNDMHGGATTCPFPNSPTDANQAALYKDGDTFLRTWVGPSPAAAPGRTIRPSSSPGMRAVSRTRARSGLPTSHPGRTPRSCPRRPPIPPAAVGATCSAAPSMAAVTFR